VQDSNAAGRVALALFTIATSVLLLWSAPQLIAQSPARPKPGSTKADTATKTTPGDDTGRPGPSTASQDPFREWQKPSAVIVFSGQQRGYLEPCGCSPEFQKGGLARRFGFVKTLQEKKWPLVLADLGGLLDGHSQPVEGKFMVGPEQAQAKLKTALQALHMMQYSVLNLGPEDMEAQQGFVGLMGLLVNIDDPPLPRAINANLGVAKDWLEAGLIYPYIVREAGAQKIAFIGMVGEEYKGIEDQELEGWQPPDKILRTTLKKVADSTLQVLMLYGKLDEARALARTFPELDVIIYGSDVEEPDNRPEWVEENRRPSPRKTMLVTVGSKGKYTGVIGLFKTGLRFELVSLDDRFDEDASIRNLLDVTYIDELKSLDLVAKAPKKPWDVKNPDLAFIGSEKCGECHEKVYEFWKTTRHSHALDTLVNGHEDKKHNKHIAKDKQFNPECVSCHTTGFFNRTGYDGTQATLHLGGNGCENCHGPGSVHARLMSNPDITSDEKREAKEMMHLGPPDDRRCVRCHDADNSPKFDLVKYWDQIDHGAEASEDKENWPTVLEKLRAKKDTLP
jgi:Cytochrome c554 and c-prime